MKLFHLSDLHLGKRLNEFSLLDDQAYILERITGAIISEKPDAVIIAGDIYDKSVPSAEAVALFDAFLSRACTLCPHFFIISGNHDSAERIAFGASLMEKSGVHLSPVYNGSVSPVTLCDGYGEVDFFMLPFIKPAHVRAVFPEETVESYSDAVRIALEAAKRRENVRSVLITHQFVTGASRCDSEDISVGGTDNVDVSCFDGFDYVALGHIHSAQSAGRDTVRYCGTPLKYSFSEARQEKSITVVELESEVKIRTVPLVPKRDLREIRGTYMELTNRENYSSADKNDYLHITLTDEEDVPDAMLKLRTIYPNIMRLDYDNRRTRENREITIGGETDALSPFELFARFYEMQNNSPLTNAQEEMITRLLADLPEDEK